MTRSTKPKLRKWMIGWDGPESTSTAQVAEVSNDPGLDVWIRRELVRMYNSGVWNADDFADSNGIIHHEVAVRPCRGPKAKEWMTFNYRLQLTNDPEDTTPTVE